MSLLKSRGSQRLTSDKQDVGTGQKVRYKTMHGSPQEPLGTVAAHRLSNSFPGSHSNPQIRQITGLGNQDNKRVGI